METRDVFFMDFFFKQKTAYEMRISDGSSDVCSSDLIGTTAAWTAAALDTRDLSGRTDLAEIVRMLIGGRGDIAQSRRAAESARQFQRAADIAGSEIGRASRRERGWQFG